MMKRRRDSLRMLECESHAHEARVVRNVASAVEDYAAGLTRDAKFLNETEIESSVAVFHSSEIVLGKLLGSGGFSQVYEAKAFNLMMTQPSAAASEMNLARRIVESTAVNHRGETTYALKHLDKRLLQKPDEFCAAAADLYVEAKYMSRFNHPNILKLRGMANGGTSAFQDGRYNSFFLLTDRLVDTLDSRLDRWAREGAGLGPMDSRLVLKTQYALQMACALEYLHKRRIVFRDLKPQNIGFKADDTVQLFDFGLCRELPEGNGLNQDETFKMSEAGTKRYMAPEINKCMGSTYNLKADSYSWAAVFYEMLSLEKPYSKISDMEFQTFVLGQGLRPQLSPLQLPHKVEHIIQEGWNHSYVQRASISQIRRALQGILQEWEAGQAQQQAFAPSGIQAQISGLAPPLLQAQVSGLTIGEGIGCPPSFVWGSSPAAVQAHASVASPQQQQPALPQPVFTFEQDFPCTKKTKAYSTAATLTTENLTSYLDDDDLSISTFDYSLSSLMDLEDDPAPEDGATQKPLLPTLSAIEASGCVFCS